MEKQKGLSGRLQTLIFLSEKSIRNPLRAGRRRKTKTTDFYVKLRVRGCVCKHSTSLLSYIITFKTPFCAWQQLTCPASMKKHSLAYGQTVKKDSLLHREKAFHFLQLYVISLFPLVVVQSTIGFWFICSENPQSDNETTTTISMTKAITKPRTMKELFSPWLLYVLHFFSHVITDISLDR